MLWIHGGSFEIGAGSQSLFNGCRLATQHGVMVASMNYRLGPLGYAAFEANTGRCHESTSSSLHLIGCGSCGFAWAMTLGEVSYKVDEKCGDLGTYAGAVVEFGHEDPNTLWTNKSGWSEAGTSKLYEGTWYFQLGNSGGGK